MLLLFDYLQEKSKIIMSFGKQSLLIPLILAGAILGGLAGYFIPEFMLSVSVIGQLFLNLLRILTIPLIISVIIVGVASLGDTHKIGRTTLASMVYFLSTSAIAVVNGIVLVSLIKPGLWSTGSEHGVGAYVPDMVAYARSFQFSDIFKAFIPSNILSSTAGGQYLGIIVLSLLFGTVLATMGRKAKVVLDFFNVITEGSLKAVQGILYIVPIGLFFLVGSAIAENTVQFSSIKIVSLIVTLLAGFLLHGIIILPVILKIFGRKSPHSYAGKMSTALLTALGTSSSTATMPVTYACVVEKNNVDSRAGAQVIPLGSFVNLNGTAMFLAVITLFACQMYGVSLNIFNIMYIGALAIVLSFCSAGVPGSSIFMIAILFSVMNLPNEAYGALGLLVAVDWLFDRARTLLNVWGNAVGAAVIGERFDYKTVSKTKSIVSPRKYERSYNKKPDYKRDKPTKQDRKPTSRKPINSKSPVAKKKDKLASPKTKARVTISKKETSPLKKQALSEKKQTISVKKVKPVSPIKKNDVKPPARRSSTLKPPPIPSARKFNKPETDSKTVEKSKPVKTSDIKDKLSIDTIERERAKIAAQLASMKERETSKTPKIDIVKPETIVDSTPQIDFYSEDEKPDKKEKFFETNNILEKVNNIKIPDVVVEKEEVDESPEAGSEIVKESDFSDNAKNDSDEIKIDSKISEDKANEKIEIEPKEVFESKTVEDAAVEPEKVSDKEPEVEPEKASDKEPEVEPEKTPDKEPEEKPEPQFGRARTRKGVVNKSDSDSEEKGKTPTPTTSSVSIVEDEKEISFGRSKTKRTGR